LLPPNAGASGTPQYSVAPPVDGRLVAVTIGRHRYALLTVGGATRIVTLGDLVGARRVVRITLRGIAFDDDSSLHIERGI
jgi:hypothetical protein